MTRVREYGILLAILGAVFSSALIFPFAHHDQYRYFQEDYGDPSFKKHCFNDSQNGSLRTLGRPLAAKLECTVFLNVSRIRDLTWFRVLALSGMALTATILAVWMQGFGVQPWSARLLAAALLSLPGGQNAVFMANLPNTVTPLLAMSAGILSLGHFRLKTHFSAWLLVGVAFFVYAPMILLFFVPLVMAFMLDTRSRDPLWKISLRACAVFLAAAAVWFVFGRRKYLSAPQDMPEAYQLKLSPALLPENWPRFYQEVLPYEFSGWDPYFWIFGPILLSLGLLFLFLPSERRNGAACLGVAAFLCANVLYFFTKAHVLFRVMWPAMCILAVLALGPALISRWRGLRLGMTAALCVCLGLVALNTHYNVRNAREEFEFVKRALSEAPANVTDIHVVMPPRNESFSGLRPITDEFNVASMSFHPGFIVEMIKLAFVETGRAGTVVLKDMLPDRAETFSDVELRAKDETEYEVLSQSKVVGVIRTGSRPKIFPWESRGEEISEERNVLNFYKLGQWRKIDSPGPNLAGRWKVENVSPLTYVSAAPPDVEPPAGAYVINPNAVMP